MLNCSLFKCLVFISNIFFFNTFSWTDTLNLVLFRIFGFHFNKFSWTDVLNLALFRIFGFHFNIFLWTDTLNLDALENTVTFVQFVAQLIDFAKVESMAAVIAVTKPTNPPVITGTVHLTGF